MWPREFAWESGISYNHDGFDRNKKRKSDHCRFIYRTLCLHFSHLQPSLTQPSHPIISLPSRLRLNNTPTASLQFPGYNTKQSDDKVPVMLELCVLRSTTLLPLLSGPLWLRVVAPDRVLSISQIELNCVFMRNWIAWDRTVLIFKLSTYTALMLGVGSPGRVLSMGQIELSCVLMINEIAWNRTVLTFKLLTYAKLNCLRLNCFDS